MLYGRNLNLIIFIVAAFLVIVIWAVAANKPIAPYLVDDSATDAVFTSTPLPKSGATGSSGKLTYDQAVKQFEGRRVQFDAMCQAIPNNFTVKNGTQIMLDNRSGDARWVSLNNFGYHLSGYGFTIVTMSSKNLPLNVLIDCGSAQNVGQILIQK